MFICQISFLNMYYIMPYVPVQVVSIGMNIRLQPFAVLCIEVDVASPTNTFILIPNQLNKKLNFQGLLTATDMA